MRYALIFLLFAIGVVSFLYPKIKKILLASAKRSSREDYKKLKKDIENALESDDEALEPYEALYSAMLEYNEQLRSSEQASLTAELPLKEQLFEPLAVLNVSTFGSVRFPTVEKSKRIKRRFFHEQDKRTYPIYLEVNRLHLNAGFCLLPMSYIPLGETYSLTVLYGFAKDSLLESGSFDINRGDRLVLDTIFDTFTYIVTDIGTIEEGDTDYLKASKETNELLLLFFSPNQTKRFCVYAEPETSSNEKESSL